MGRYVPVVLGLLLGLSACAWRGPEPLQAFSPLDPSPTVMAADEAAYKLVAISQLQTERDSDGRMKLTIEFNNLSAQDLAVQVQTVFRNKEGSLYGDETNWQMLTLPGSGDVRYEIVSLQSQAETFVVQVRTP